LGWTHWAWRCSIRCDPAWDAASGFVAAMRRIGKVLGLSAGCATKLLTAVSFPCAASLLERSGGWFQKFSKVSEQTPAPEKGPRAGQGRPGKLASERTRATLPRRLGFPRLAPKIPKGRTVLPGPGRWGERTLGCLAGCHRGEMPIDWASVVVATG